MIYSVLAGAGLICLAGNLYFTLNPKYRKLENYLRSSKDSFGEKRVMYEIDTIKNINAGYEYILKCLDGGCKDDLEKKVCELDKVFKAKCEVIDIPYTDKIILRVVDKPVLALEYKKVDCSGYELVLGHNNLGDNIIVNMLDTAHLGVAGASMNGKSVCVENALCNIQNKANITLVNVFEDDFKRLYNAKRVNGSKQILDYLKRLLEVQVKRDKPLYVVIDEYNVLSNDKSCNKAIQDLLSQARHFNIFLIVLMQVGNKEDCKFKNLFNARVCFRFLDKSMIDTFLGVTIQDKNLNKQDFFLYSDKLEKGRSFNIKKL